MYFRELFGDDFIRFDEDVINAGLIMDIVSLDH